MIKQVLISSLFTISVLTRAQTPHETTLPANWYNSDHKADGVFGISMERAYPELLKNRKSVPIVVAVIDGGVDIYHEDLKDIIWTNPNEIPGNGKDDDHNGYVDDLHGWNFLGSSKEDFEYDSDLLVIELRNLQAKLSRVDTTNGKQENLADYNLYNAKKLELAKRLDKVNRDIASITKFLHDVEVVSGRINKDKLTIADLEKFVPTNVDEQKAKHYMINILKNNPDFDSYIAQTRDMLQQNIVTAKYHLNLEYNPRLRFASEYPPYHNRFYGNNNVYGAVPPEHGTHITGILAAERHNGIGVNGVADNVKIMVLRAIPDGYGLDLDQANAIRYAADNGAKIINMSFGIGIAIDPKSVRDAIKYALKKGVLFIQAAGNGHDNLDKVNNYPNRNSKADTRLLNSFIKVGATGPTEKELVFPASNYGKASVDVFAPGSNIYSTIPGNKYEIHSGTSMAAPVVSGLAAVLWSRFPKLKAQEVKKIIIASVYKRAELKELCISGGIVNAFNALQLAASYF